MGHVVDEYWICDRCGKRENTEDAIRDWREEPHTGGAAVHAVHESSTCYRERLRGSRRGGSLPFRVSGLQRLQGCAGRRVLRTRGRAAQS